MIHSVFTLVWLLQPAPPHGVFGTARPVECGTADGSRAANVWARAKEPNLRRYCDLLASGSAKLVGRGSMALVGEVPKIADEADKLLPGRAAPSVLKGRALLRLNRSDDAFAALSEARRRDERALDDPVALLAWARVNARLGRREEAARAYRAALPRTSSLSAQERASASFEAAMTVMEAGTDGIDDAIAMFRQARREAQDALQIASVVALALALDRAGLRDEARGVLAERGRVDMKSVLAEPRVAEAMTDAGVRHEGSALVGMVLEDVAASKEAWREYLDGEGGKGPWSEHARERAGLPPKKANAPSSVRTAPNGGAR